MTRQSSAVNTSALAAIPCPTEVRGRPTDAANCDHDRPCPRPGETVAPRSTNWFPTLTNGAVRRASRLRSRRPSAGVSRSRVRNPPPRGAGRSLETSTPSNDRYGLKYLAPENVNDRTNGR